MEEDRCERTTAGRGSAERGMTERMVGMVDMVGCGLCGLWWDEEQCVVMVIQPTGLDFFFERRFGRFDGGHA